MDKVYKQKNLEIAWERVQANRGSGGVDGQSLEEFEAQATSDIYLASFLRLGGARHLP